MAPALMSNYGRYGVTFERGEGAYLYTTDNAQYLDFGTGIAVVSLGHCHPHLVSELQAQVGRLWHTSNLYNTRIGERMAQRLVDATFADRVLFCNSGAEAVECGLKMIRKYMNDIGQPNRYRVITCAGSFHGRTMGTIAAGGQDKVKDGFAPIVPDFDHVPYGNLNEVRAAIGPQTAGILVEPILGEGGLRQADPEYLRGLREVADEFSLLLMFDEVQTGVGRTGKFLACEWAGVEPDIVALAKGLGGGFPIGACLAKQHAADALSPGTHGTTFGGNFLAMAAGNAVLDIVLADGFLDEVSGVADSLWRQLLDLQKRYPMVIEEVRGAGLMIGLKCVVPNTDLVNNLLKRRMLVVPAADNVARLLPPLNINEIHIEQALNHLEAACEELGNAGT
ncbi:MAG: acetylornithine transaminase [Rhodospirillales bacterium]|jgi:acetylornithine/N-succinyldiaminopimelate aminotransferase